MLALSQSDVERTEVSQGKVVALSGMVLAGILYYADEIIFAIPIIGMTAWQGPVVAFALFVPLYFLFDYGLGSLSLWIVQNDLDEVDTRTWSIRKKIVWSGVLFVKGWYSSLYDSDFGDKIRKGLTTKSGAILRLFSFLVVSYLGTAFLVVPVMYLIGQRKHLRLITAVSASIYALTFVGKYTTGTFLGVAAISWLYRTVIGVI